MTASDLSGGASQLWEVADALHTDQEIDWPAVESAAPAEQRPVIQRMKLIAEIFAAHKVSLGQASAQITPATATTPQRWGPLDVLEKIGEGAFGEVYRARDRKLNRQVALKFFRPERMGSAAAATEIVEEGRLLAMVQHPNVVTVHGADQRDGRTGIWMEFVTGATLEEILAERGCLGATEAMALGQDLCRALTALHRAGVIHRDIKARNVMRGADGRVVLMDLGVSCEVDHQTPVKQYGTPLYAAPEVLRAEAATPRSDIYSVGVLLFHLVTGEYPVTGATLAEVKNAHASGLYRQLKELDPEIDEAFSSIVTRALVPDPDLRFDTTNEFEQALDAALARQRAGPGKNAPATGRRTEAHAPNQQAYTAYLQGLHFFTRRYGIGDGVSRAMAYFEQAIAHDPDFALPHVGIADCLNVTSYYQYLRPREGFPQARAAIERALALDPDLGEAYASLGYLNMYFDWDFTAAENHFRRAVELNPRYVLAYQWHGMLFSSLGRHDEALAKIEEGRRLDPAALTANMEAMALGVAGRNEEAVHAFRMTVEVNPDSLWHLANLGLYLWTTGQVEEALENCQRAVALSKGEDSLSVGYLAILLVLTKREDEAHALIENMEKLALSRYVSPSHRFLPWLALDRHDMWGPLLAEAIEERDPFLLWMRAPQGMAPWRADPRFAEPLRQVGLVD